MSDFYDQDAIFQKLDKKIHEIIKSLDRKSGCLILILSKNVTIKIGFLDIGLGLEEKASLVPSKNCFTILGMVNF